MTRNAIALTRLLMRERPSLLRLAERILGSRPAAEDVTQSLWIKLQRVEDDPPILRKRAYLYRLASNLTIDVARAEQRRGTAHDEAMAILDNGVDGLHGERITLARDELARVKRAIDALPATTREVFLLSRLENMPQRAIAAQLGISPDCRKASAQSAGRRHARRGGRCMIFCSGRLARQDCGSSQSWAGSCSGLVRWKNT